MDLMNLVIAGIMFVVLGFVLSIGQTILDTNTQAQCSNLGGNWVTGNFTNVGALTNPVTNAYRGCCASINTSTNATPALFGINCSTWYGGSYALNSSQYSMSAVNTLAYWLPIIALAVAAGFVISILIVYLLGSVTGRHTASV